MSVGGDTDTVSRDMVSPNKLSVGGGGGGNNGRARFLEKSVRDDHSRNLVPLNRSHRRGERRRIASLGRPAATSRTTAALPRQLTRNSCNDRVATEVPTLPASHQQTVPQAGSMKREVDRTLALANTLDRRPKGIDDRPT